ncbi:MAG: metallophosphoesterase family protein [Planctomycetota bacterium]
MTKTPRTIAIGDIHGCSTALKTLLDRLDLQHGELVVVLGDAIDRGPDSRGVIDQLLTLRERVNLVCILGNHEQMLLDTIDGASQAYQWLIHGGAETLDSYGKNFGHNSVDPVHLEFLRDWVDVYEDPTHFFVHGNYLPKRPLQRQPWSDLRWEPISWRMPTPHVSGKTAVVGHTSNKQAEIVNAGHLVCIDTYCYGGGWLTALDSASGQVWQSDEGGDFRAGVLPPIDGDDPHPDVA